jgi:GxxExxY protein
MTDLKVTEINLANHYSGQVVDASMKVHSILGPGLLEKVYEACLTKELQKRGLSVQSQVWMPVEYEGTIIDLGYRIDLLVENTVLVELKAVEHLRSLHKAQVLSYLRLKGLKIGLLINFNTVSLKNGIHRIINGY